MQFVILGLLYLLFFFSGASALIYEVAWVRSFSLVFGGSHLAVTTVLSVFMAGLALGSYRFGKRADASRKPLRLYGLLELGIALSAVLFILLMKVYPLLYVPLARGVGDHPVLLSLLRVLFATGAMIVPTTLMGGTLPVLSRFVATRPGLLGNRLSFLYGVNTLGAATGTLAAGFLLLPSVTLTGTLAIAIGINACIGGLAILLQNTASSLFPGGPSPARREGLPVEEGPGLIPRTGRDSLPARLVLLGIGISGFCALGYEVLWTRVLALVIGATVYGFTIMLVAFLTGIASGSGTYGLFRKIRGRPAKDPKIPVAGFGLVQVVIGLSALAVTVFLRDLPAQAIRAQNFLLGMDIGEFDVRQGANFLVAFSYMFVPAFFMGLAFPMAGEVRAEYRESAGVAVGEVLTYNTVGAILGAALSGFVLIYLFGVERSLQILTLVNVGTGFLVVAGATGRRALVGGASATALAALLALALLPGRWKIWDTKYFAIYRNNLRGAFDNPEKIRDAMENTEVLFYHEGNNETISVIRVKGGSQAVLVNGKVVASSTRQDVQCQMTLGHLPMLLHRNPRKVWVLGLGTGMTVGAVSVHPEVEEITLCELEPGVVPAARTFGALNHQVLDNPKLKIVYNDGRNHLLTTTGKYDVITADPIHPWAQGAAYLYTTEYYRLASKRLLPGGIMCQWLPIYELTVEDLQSVVKTFGENFKYTLLWLTHYDAELIGSNDPILIDEAQLERRMSSPAVRKDLGSVEMGSPADFLSYFVAGTKGLQAFGGDGIVNTDDNLYLEFSAPLSVGLNRMGRNVEALTRYRESLLPYLLPVGGEAQKAAQKARWEGRLEVGRGYDHAHALFLEGRYETPEFASMLTWLGKTDSGYAPARFLRREYMEAMARNPVRIGQEIFTLLTEEGQKRSVEISAVTMRVGKERAVVVFVDNRAREIYGQRYFDGPGTDLDRDVRRLVDDTMAAIRAAYEKEAAAARGRGGDYPPADGTLQKIRDAVSLKVREG